LELLFSNQTNLTFSKFLEPLNQYNCSRIGLLGQGRERTSQDETLTYQTFQIQMTLVEIQIDGTLF
jgi:hypothetical protein